MDESKYDVKRLDHLGLVTGFCKEIGLNEWVDTHFPKESHNSHITKGQLFVAMLLNGLGFLATFLSLKAQAQDTKGLFIIATNDCSEDVSMQLILDEYKSQQAVETKSAT